jgi:hypothetical protein
VTIVRDVSLSGGSEVSLGPEEDGEMVDVEPCEDTGIVLPSEPEVESGSTYVLIHGHSFSFGAGDLRSWLQRLGDETVLASISGIY